MLRLKDVAGAAMLLLLLATAFQRSPPAHGSPQRYRQVLRRDALTSSPTPTQLADPLTASSAVPLTVPIRTLLIDNFDSYTYNIWQLLAEVNGAPPAVVYNNAYGRDWDALLAAHPDVDNIVLSPGPWSPDVAADFGLCMDAIRRADVPVLGVCLGHQGIAHAFGGTVARAPLPMHGRLSPITHTGTGLFTGVPQGTEVVRYHSLIAKHPLPPGLDATAWTADGLVMGLQVRPACYLICLLRRLFTRQFAPFAWPARDAATVWRPGAYLYPSDTHTSTLPSPPSSLDPSLIVPPGERGHAVRPTVVRQLPRHHRAAPRHPPAPTRTAERR